MAERSNQETVFQQPSDVVTFLGQIDSNISIVEEIIFQYPIAGTPFVATVQNNRQRWGMLNESFNPTATDNSDGLVLRNDHQADIPFSHLTFDQSSNPIMIVSPELISLSEEFDTAVQDLQASRVEWNQRYEELDNRVPTLTLAQVNLVINSIIENGGVDSEQLDQLLNDPENLEASLVRGLATLAAIQTEIERCPEDVEGVSLQPVMDAAVAFTVLYERHLSDMSDRLGLDNPVVQLILSVLAALLSLLLWLFLANSILAQIIERLVKAVSNFDLIDFDELMGDAPEDYQPDLRFVPGELPPPPDTRIPPSDFEGLEVPRIIEGPLIDHRVETPIITSSAPGPNGKITKTGDGRAAIEFDNGTIVEDQGTPIPQNDAVDRAIEWVGSGYYEYPLGSNHFYSQSDSDGTVHRVRITEGDINDTRIGPHINFERGRWKSKKGDPGNSTFDVEQNIHVRIN